MKKEIILRQGNFNYLTCNKHRFDTAVLCCLGIRRILRKTPNRIKITVSNKNPKKKGWHSFALCHSDNLVNFHGRNFFVYRYVKDWLIRKFPNGYKTKLAFKIEEI